MILPHDANPRPDGIFGKDRIEMLKEIVPNAYHASLLFNPDTATYAAYYLQPFEVPRDPRGSIRSLRQFEMTRIAAVAGRLCCCGPNIAAS